MAGNKCLTPIQSCALRVARLAVDGTTPAGATNAVVIDGYSKLEVKPEIQDGVDFQVANACGRNVVCAKEPNTILRYNLTLSLLNADWEAIELISRFLLIVDGGGLSIGAASPKLCTPLNADGVSLEIWSKLYSGGSQSAVAPFMRTLFAKTYGWTRTDPMTFENAPLSFTLQGFAVENINIGNGPFNDWTGPADRVYAHREETTMPTPVCGYVTVPAQV